MNQNTDMDKRARFFEWLELCLLFIALPFLLSLGTPAALRRSVLFIACFYALFRLRGKVNWRWLWGRPWQGWWRGPVIRGAIAAAGLLCWVLFFDKGEFLNFPRQRPFLWLVVMILYPVLSVVPQEIIYRVFIFSGHRNALPTMGLRVLVSAVLFGWLHVIYAGYFAIFSSALAGLAIGVSYNLHEGKKGAIWPIILEHALYGQLVFTLGLGKYFYLARGGGVV